MQDRRPLFIAALLTGTAGFVDAVGFLSLGRIYTANMSGNSVAIAIEGASQNWAALIHRICPVAAYFAGLIFGRLVIQVGAELKFRQIASVAMFIEILLLLPASAWPAAGTRLDTAEEFACIALLALAMGVQNAALTRFSTLTVHTGFVTGTLLKCAEQTVKYVTLVIHQWRKEQSLWRAVHLSMGSAPLQAALWLAAIWIAYVAGALGGAFAKFSFAFRALLIPIACLLTVIAIDMRKALAVNDEEEQVKLTN